LLNNQDSPLFVKLSPNVFEDKFLIFHIHGHERNDAQERSLVVFRETAPKGSVTGGEVHFGGWMVEKGPGTDLASKVPSRDLSPHSDLSSSRKLQLYQWTKLQFVS